jgi:hypothetical protein
MSLVKDPLRNGVVFEGVIFGLENDWRAMPRESARTTAGMPE